MSDQQITLRFTPTRGDYVSTLRQYYARDRRIALTFAMLALQVICFSALFAMGRLGQSPWILLLMLPLPLAAAYIFLLLPLSVGRKVARYPQLTEPVTWRVDEHGIAITDGKKESLLAWERLRAMMGLNGYYLMIHADNPRMYHFVPKRAFESPEHEGAFYHLARRQILAAQGRGRNGTPPHE